MSSNKSDSNQVHVNNNNIEKGSIVVDNEDSQEKIEKMPNSRDLKSV